MSQEDVIQYWTEEDLYEPSDEDEDNLKIKNEDDLDIDSDYELPPPESLIENAQERIVQAVAEFEEDPKIKEKKELSVPEGQKTKKFKKFERDEEQYNIKLFEEIVVGKDGEYFWSTKPQVNHERKISRKSIVHIRPRTKNNAAIARQPLDCFKSFFTDDIINLILVHTNAEILRKKSNYKNESSTVRPLVREELYALLGIIMFSGVMKNNHLSAERLFDSKYCGEKYRATFSRSRFTFLIAALRFDDKKSREERKSLSKLAPISEIWTKLIHNCKVNYEPSACLTINEQLLEFRGSCPFKMYLPSKPNKYGMKIVMLCDQSTKYMCNAIPYLGKGTIPEKTPAGNYFVENLVADLKGTNRCITTGNWFTNIPLAKKLLNEYLLTTIGTIKNNERELPEVFTDLKFKNRPTGSSLFLFSPDVTAVSYKPKPNKLVTLISTEYDDNSIHKNAKPKIISNYNETKGAVDTFDQFCQNTNCCRATQRWSMAYFYNMINIAMYNSYVIYLHNFFKHRKYPDLKPLNRFDYTIRLVDETIEPLLLMRLEYIHLPNETRNAIQKCLSITKEEDNLEIKPETSSSRKYCSFCHYSKRRMSKMKCKPCDKSVCGDHYHKVCVICYNNKF